MITLLLDTLRRLRRCGGGERGAPRSPTVNRRPGRDLERCAALPCPHRPCRRPQLGASSQARVSAMSRHGPDPMRPVLVPPGARAQGEEGRIEHLSAPTEVTRTAHWSMPQTACGNATASWSRCSMFWRGAMRWPKPLRPAPRFAPEAPNHTGPATSFALAHGPTPLAGTRSWG